jgi:hypothetical protein
MDKRLFRCISQSLAVFTLVAVVLSGQVVSARSASPNFVGPTIVGLAYFTAIPAEGGILVAWETASELNMAAFNVFRSTASDGEYIQLNQEPIPVQGGDTGGAVYQWLDTTAQSGSFYYYKLQIVDRSGGTTFAGPVGPVGLVRYLWLPLISR